MTSFYYCISDFSNEQIVIFQGKIKFTSLLVGFTFSEYTRLYSDPEAERNIWQRWELESVQELLTWYVID